MAKHGVFQDRGISTAPIERSEETRVKMRRERDRERRALQNEGRMPRMTSVHQSAHLQHVPPIGVPAMSAPAQRPEGMEAMMRVAMIQQQGFLRPVINPNGLYLRDHEVEQPEDEYDVDPATVFCNENQDKPIALGSSQPPIALPIKLMKAILKLKMGLGSTQCGKLIQKLAEEPSESKRTEDLSTAIYDHLSNPHASNYVRHWIQVFPAVLPPPPIPSTFTGVPLALPAPQAQQPPPQQQPSLHYHPDPNQIQHRQRHQHRQAQQEFHQTKPHQYQDQSHPHLIHNTQQSFQPQLSSNQPHMQSLEIQQQIQQQLQQQQQLQERLQQQLQQSQQVESQQQQAGVVSHQTQPSDLDRQHRQQQQTLRPHSPSFESQESDFEVNQNQGHIVGRNSSGSHDSSGGSNKSLQPQHSLALSSKSQALGKNDLAQMKNERGWIPFRAIPIDQQHEIKDVARYHIKWETKERFAEWMGQAYGCYLGHKALREWQLGKGSIWKTIDFNSVPKPSQPLVLPQGFEPPAPTSTMKRKHFGPKACPNGHMLTPSEAEGPEYFVCDACKATNFAPGTIMHGCEECDYDICPGCYDTAQPTKDDPAVVPAVDADISAGQEMALTLQEKMALRVKDQLLAQSNLNDDEREMLALAIATEHKLSKHSAKNVSAPIKKPLRPVDLVVKKGRPRNDEEPSTPANKSKKHKEEVPIEEEDIKSQEVSESKAEMTPTAKKKKTKIKAENADERVDNVELPTPQPNAKRKITQVEEPNLEQTSKSSKKRRPDSSPTKSTKSNQSLPSPIKATKVKQGKKGKHEENLEENQDEDEDDLIPNILLRRDAHGKLFVATSQVPFGDKNVTSNATDPRTRKGKALAAEEPKFKDSKQVDEVVCVKTESHRRGRKSRANDDATANAIESLQSLARSKPEASDVSDDEKSKSDGILVIKRVPVEPGVSSDGGLKITIHTQPAVTSESKDARKPTSIASDESSGSSQITLRRSTHDKVESSDHVAANSSKVSSEGSSVEKSTPVTSSSRRKGRSKTAQVETDKVVVKTETQASNQTSEETLDLVIYLKRKRKGLVVDYIGSRELAPPRVLTKAKAKP